MTEDAILIIGLIVWPLAITVAALLITVDIALVGLCLSFPYGFGLAAFAERHGC